MDWTVSVEGKVTNIPAYLQPRDYSRLLELSFQLFRSEERKPDTSRSLATATMWPLAQHLSPERY